MDLSQKSAGPWSDLHAAIFVFNQFMRDTLNLSHWNREQWYFWELIPQPVSRNDDI